MKGGLRGKGGTKEPCNGPWSAAAEQIEKRGGALGEKKGAVESSHVHSLTTSYLTFGLLGEGERGENSCALPRGFRSRHLSPFASHNLKKHLGKKPDGRQFAAIVVVALMEEGEEGTWRIGGWRSCLDYLSFRLDSREEGFWGKRKGGSEGSALVSYSFYLLHRLGGGDLRKKSDERFEFATHPHAFFVSG